jgi:release factor glutamine methyltransferase
MKPMHDMVCRATGDGDLAGLTLGEAVRRASKALADAAIEPAPREARILVAAASRRPSIDLIADAEAPLDAASARRLAEFLERRTRREPISRILGERDFYGRTFELSSATLDPRPDSETVIEAALEILKEEGLYAEPIRILDIGTGSGCLVVTLLAELPSAFGLATDISASALKTALRNAQRHGVADRLVLRQADALEEVEGRYNLIVSNPPYIPSEEIPLLDEEVRRFDPKTALDGGPDGLEIFRRIVSGLSEALDDEAAPAWALFEVGAGQAGDVAAILARSGFAQSRTWLDLGGHTRCVAVQSLDGGGKEKGLASCADEATVSLISRGRKCLSTIQKS